VERDVVHHREHLEFVGRWPVRRQILVRSRNAGIGGAHPAALVVGRESIEGVVILELPLAILEHRSVFVDRRTHGGTRTKAHLLEHADADFRGLAVGRDVDHRLQLHVIAEPPRHRPLRAPAEYFKQECAYAFAAIVGTPLGEFHGTSTLNRFARSFQRFLSR